MRSLFILLSVVLLCPQAIRADNSWGLKTGAPNLQAADRLTFGPKGILFVGDAKGAAIFAFDTGDANGDPATVSYAIEKLDDRLQETLGNAAKVAINDLAVNPNSGNVYLAISSGEDKSPGLVKIDATGKFSVVAWQKLPFLKTTLPNPPEDKITGEGPRAKNRRNEAITDLAYLNGKVLVAGLTNDAAPSNVREITFPFVAADAGTQLEIYHAAHGKVEDYAAVRTFIPFNIDGQPALLAGFTCTPLVRFSLDELATGKKLRGTTVAELGNRNTPLDMIAYEKQGEQFLLLANSARGVMKISTKEISKQTGLTTPVSGGGTAGLSFAPVAELNGTVQLDRLNDRQAVVIIQQEGVSSLRSVNLP